MWDMVLHICAFITYFCEGAVFQEGAPRFSRGLGRRQVSGATLPLQEYTKISWYTSNYSLVLVTILFRWIFPMSALGLVWEC